MIDQTILCSGATNDSALVEIKVKISTDKNLIQIDDNAFSLQLNNDFALSWTNTVDKIRYDNYLSKITGNLTVFSINPEQEQPSVRANLICVQENKKAIT